MTKPLAVLFVASEVTPLAKVGGLADVAGALPIALRRQGIDARILMPFYGAIDRSRHPFTKIADRIEVQARGQAHAVSVWKTVLPTSDVPVYLIDNDHFFGGDRVYYDASAFVNQFVEFERFLFFGLAVAAVLPRLEFQPDVLHCHDWHTGIVPVLVRRVHKSGVEKHVPATVFTIHNLANQGRWIAREILDFVGLDKSDDPALSEWQDNQDLNLMATGIRSADWVNTVSPGYAREILTPEYGEALQDVLTTRRDRLTGILNGIDVDRFDPATDAAIPAPYAAEQFDRKSENKRALQTRLGLQPDPSAPIFGFVGRLTDQKGMDLIGEVIDRLVAHRGQVVILGAGMNEYETIARDAARQYPGAVSTTIGFDPVLAQLVYAGSDFFLMPSRFEPCGLGQMIAMRYGTIPIVRATGGLKDTVPNYTKDQVAGRGFSFDDYAPGALWAAIEKALALYETPDKFATLGRRLMTIDFSWDASSRAYIDLYASALQTRKEQT